MPFVLNVRKIHGGVVDSEKEGSSSLAYLENQSIQEELEFIEIRNSVDVGPPQSSIAEIAHRNLNVHQSSDKGMFWVLSKVSDQGGKFEFHCCALPRYHDLAQIRVSREN